MKYLVALIVALIGFNLSYAQPTLYGLQFARTGTSVPVTGFQRFVQVDLLTGAYVVLDTIPAVRGVVVGSSTFDHNNHRYIFWGIDSNSTKRLYNLDAPTGVLLTSPPLSSNPVELQYDMKNGILYGLSWDSQSQKQYMVSVNLQTGATTQVGSIAGVRAVVVTGTAFNSNNGTYYLYGRDSLNVQRLFRIQASTGQVLSSVALNLLLSEFQYDVTSNQLLGLYRPGQNQELQLVSIDTLTAALTQLAVFPGFSGPFAGVSVGASTYDQNTGTYIFRGRNGGDSLYAVATQNGAILANPILDNVIELEADNTSFAARRYNPSTQIPGPILKEDLIQLVAYPNPAGSNLTVELSSKVPLNGQLSLTDLSGQELMNRLIMTRKVPGYFELDLSSLLPGIYLLKANTQEGSKTLKIIRL